MASSFKITTTATELIKINPDGRTAVVFTVTNTAPRPVRGIAKAKALNNSKQEWLKVEGETERDFAPGGTQQLTVNFNAQGAAPGTYSFRLDIASSANPDEDFSESPPVAIEIAEIKQPAKKKLSIWIWLIPVILGVILIGGLIIWLVPRDTSYKLSSVAGLNEIDARERLEKDFKYSVKCATVSIKTENNDDIKKGLVIRSDPEAGAKVRVGDAVTIYVSEGPEIFALVSVAGQEKDEAKKKLEEFCQSVKPCLNVEIQTENSDLIKEGLAIRTEPTEGNPVEHNSKIKLFISAGPQMLVVKRYIGFTDVIAQILIVKAGFTVGTVNLLPSTPSPVPTKNVVIGQDPPPGETRSKGTPINLVTQSVPRGPITLGKRQLDSEQ
jgi:beta-lactam-binding protein with PASTA domain